jgi:hypothetical protein
LKYTHSAIIMLILSFLASSCAKAPLGKSGLQGEITLSAVRDLTGAYEKRDLDAFMDRVSPAYPGRDALQKSVGTVFATYRTIHFRIHYSKMLVTVQEKGNIKTTYTWEGEWQSAGGKIVKDGARVTLVLDPGSYKLVGIEGKNPFVLAENPSPVKQ